MFITIAKTIRQFFPSITDNNGQSAKWFIDNGMPESAKRVIDNMSKLIDQMANDADFAGLDFDDLYEALKSETESVNYWRNNSEELESRLKSARESEDFYHDGFNFWFSESQYLKTRNEDYAREIFELNARISNLESRLESEIQQTAAQMESAMLDAETDITELLAGQYDY